MKTGHKVIAVLSALALCATVPAVNYLIDLRRADSTPSDLYNVVYSQVNAFRAEDYSLAYAQASYGMHLKFSREQFEKMIRTDYAEFTTAGRIEFGLIKYRDRHALIQVFFIGRDGSVLPCIYSLIYERAQWKVDGAVTLPPWPPGSGFEGLEA